MQLPGSRTITRTGNRWSSVKPISLDHCIRRYTVYGAAHSFLWCTPVRLSSHSESAEHRPSVRFRWTSFALWPTGFRFSACAAWVTSEVLPDHFSKTHDSCTRLRVGYGEPKKCLFFSFPPNGFQYDFSPLCCAHTWMCIRSSRRWSVCSASARVLVFFVLRSGGRMEVQRGADVAFKWPSFFGEAGGCFDSSVIDHRCRPCRRFVLC